MMMLAALLLPLALLGVLLGMERLERWVSNDIADSPADEVAAAPVATPVSGAGA